MNVESLREFCLSLPQVTECFPFDEWVLVFKIEGKMFLFCDLSAEEKRISLKCDPELAIELRERYPEIEPGYHTNKRPIHISKNRTKTDFSRKEPSFTATYNDPGAASVEIHGNLSLTKI